MKKDALIISPGWPGIFLLFAVFNCINAPPAGAYQAGVLQESTGFNSRTAHSTIPSPAETSWTAAA
jgi:hypothetical protein